MPIATPHDTTIGSRVRSHRERRKMTQAQLAAHIGVTFQQVHKYERGTNRIAASRLAQIADALDVSFGTLMGQAVNPSDPVGEMAATQSGREMAEAWLILPANLQRAVLQLAKSAAPPIITGTPGLAIDFAALDGMARA